jgi:hypothetical protein
MATSTSLNVSSAGISNLAPTCVAGDEFYFQIVDNTSNVQVTIVPSVVLNGPDLAPILFNEANAAGDLASRSNIIRLKPSYGRVGPFKVVQGAGSWSYDIRTTPSNSGESESISAVWVRSIKVNN